jgi:hypothetical protein
MSQQKAKLDRSLDKTFDEVEGFNLMLPEASQSPSLTSVSASQQKPKHDSYEATLSQISYLMQKLQQESAGRDLSPNQTIEQHTSSNFSAQLSVKNVKSEQKWGSSTSRAQSWVSSVPRIANKSQPSFATKTPLRSNGAVEVRLMAFGKQTSQKKIELREQQVAKLEEDMLDVKLSKVPITKLARCSSEHVVGVPISDRLYQYGLRAKDRKAKLAMAHIADEEAKMKPPMITTASQKCTRTVEDLFAWEQRKHQRHNQMRLSKESSFSVSQQPTVCKGTLKIVEKLKDRFAVPLEQRLLNNDKQSKIEELKRERSRQELDAIESTKVQMSETSKQIMAQKHDREKVAIGIRLSENRRHSCFYAAPEKLDFTHTAPKVADKSTRRPTSAPRERSIIPIEDRLLAMGELYEEKKRQEIAESNLRSARSVLKMQAHPEHANSQDSVWNRLFQEKILMNKGQRVSCQPESPQNYFEKLDDIENCTFRYKPDQFIPSIEKSFVFMLIPKINSCAVLQSQPYLKSSIGDILVEKQELTDWSGCMSGCVLLLIEKLKPQFQHLLKFWNSGHSKRPKA